MSNSMEYPSLMMVSTHLSVVMDCHFSANGDRRWPNGVGVCSWVMVWVITGVLGESKAPSLAQVRFPALKAWFVGGIWSASLLMLLVLRLVCRRPVLEEPAATATILRGAVPFTRFCLLVRRCHAHLSGGVTSLLDRVHCVVCICIKQPLAVKR